jgi:hypothetical protein
MCKLFIAAATAAISAAFTASTGRAQTYWQNETSAAITDDIDAVVFANGTFEATTAQGNVLSSLDGVSWTSQNVSPGALNSIAYGNGAWVVVGANGTIFVSTDLKAWSTASSGTTANLNAVVCTYDSHQFVFYAVGDGGTVLTSTDAKKWVAIPSGVSNSLTGIGATFLDVIISGQGGIILDHVGTGPGEPRVIQTGASSGLNALAFGQSATTVSALTYVAVGSAGLITSGTLVDSGMVAIPPTNWSRAKVPSTADLWGIAYAAGVFLATGDNGTILVSPDGNTWTQQFPGSSYQNMSTATLLAAGFSFSLNRFVVVGKGGAILVSDAPKSYLANVSARGFVSSTQAFIGGFVVEGTGLRSVLVRADGPTLQNFGVSGALPDPVLTVYDSHQNLVGQVAGWSSQADSDSVSAAALEVGAFSLPMGSKDSAFLLALWPGAYTAVISSAAGNSGTALFEAYVY